jgi:hypothetical protein
MSCHSHRVIVVLTFSKAEVTLFEQLIYTIIIKWWKQQKLLPASSSSSEVALEKLITINYKVVEPSKVVTSIIIII